MQKMQHEFSASMMCASYGHLEDEVRELEAAGIDSFHIDIMDGQFVPNFGMGLQDLKFIRSATKKPIEAHLMIRNPASYLELFLENVDVIYVHPESDYHPSTTLQKIIQAGVMPCIAINPGTSVESIQELLFIAKRVLVMAVNPGHAGQVYLPYVGQKIEKLLAMRENYGFEVYWDGSCTQEKVETYAPKGVKGFILGTALLFGHNKPYKELLAAAREMTLGK